MKQTQTIFIIVMLMLVSLTPALANEKNSTVTRTYPVFNGTGMITFNASTGEMMDPLPVTVNTMTTNDTGFGLFTESIPSVFLVSLISNPNDTSLQVNGGNTYTFTAMGNNFTYSLSVDKQPENKRDCISTYEISGTYIDSYFDTGKILPKILRVNIIPIQDDFHLYSAWDNNSDGMIDRSEVVVAIADWFGDNPIIDRDSIFKLINKFFDKTSYMFTKPCDK